MLTVKFELHDTSVELPEKSGEYLVFAESNWVTRAPFSTKWQKFNVSDFDDSDETAIGVFFWSEFPEELKRAIKCKMLEIESGDKL